MPNQSSDTYDLFIYLLIFVGGSDDSGTGLDEVIEFNTDTEEWSLVDNMREGRRGHAASIVDINIAEQFCLL